MGRRKEVTRTQEFGWNRQSVGAVLTPPTPVSSPLAPKVHAHGVPVSKDPPVPSRPLSLPCLPFTSSLSLFLLFSLHGHLFSLQQNKFLTPLGGQQSPTPAPHHTH